MPAVAGPSETCSDAMVRWRRRAGGDDWIGGDGRHRCTRQVELHANIQDNRSQPWWWSNDRVRDRDVLQSNWEPAVLQAIVHDIWSQLHLCANVAAKDQVARRRNDAIC